MRTMVAYRSRGNRGYIHIGKTILIVSIVVTAIAATEALIIDKELTEDINSNLDRAESATTAKQMAHYVSKSVNGMNKYGMRKGSWAVIYKNPETNIAHSRIQLRELWKRLLEIESTYEQGSMDYSKSLEEAKTSFSKISIEPYEWYTLREAPHLHPFYLLLWLTPLWCLSAILVPFAWDKPLIPNRVICRLLGHKPTTQREPVSGGEVKGCERCGEILEMSKETEEEE